MNRFLHAFLILGIALSSVTFAQSARELLKHARKGNVASMKKLGKRLIAGDRVKKDVINGVKWIKMAADKGDSGALLILGDLSRQGIGMPKNEVIAQQYYKKAAEAGNEDAAKRLAKYEDREEQTEQKNEKKKKTAKGNHTGLNQPPPNKTISSPTRIPEEPEIEEKHSTHTETPAPAETVNIDEKLLEAAEQGDYEGVKNYLQQKANINHTKDKDETALTLAAHKGHEEIVKLLLDSGADISYVRNTPWCYSSVSIAKLLVNAGADVNWVTDYSPTLAPWCFMHDNPEFVKFYIANHADFNKNVQHSALYWCLTRVPVTEEDKKNKLECLRLMIEAGAKPSTNDLAIAAESGHTEAVSMFLKAGADAACENREGYTPLLYAALNGHTETARVIREFLNAKK